MSDYLDGELTLARRRRVEDHLGECAECRRLLAGLHRILDGLHRFPTPSEGVDTLRIAASVRGQLSELD
jgi:anti-sigma factor RsiW